MKTNVKKWFREKNYGFLDNGGGPDIKVNQKDLLNCQYLKVGATVEFECYSEQQGLVARKVKLSRQSKENTAKNHQHNKKPFKFGVMT